MTNMSKIEHILGAKPIEPVREQINGKRHYILKQIQETPMVSVTSVIGDVINKPALVNWGKNLGISAGVDTLKDYVGTYIGNMYGNCQESDLFVFRNASKLF